MIQATLFETSREENHAARTRANEAHFQRLVEVLGDGRDWDFTGNVGEDEHSNGVCSCGHRHLRYLFELKNRKTAATAIVGSTCINHFSEARPDLVEAIGRKAEELERQAAERKRQAKRNAQEERVRELLTTLNNEAWKLTEYLAGFPSYKRVRYDMWQRNMTPIGCQRALPNDTDRPHWLCRTKQYKSLTAYIKKLETRIAAIRDWQADPWE